MPTTKASTRPLHRRVFSFAAFASLFVPPITAALAEGEPCPPPPARSAAAPDIGPIYVDRDSVSCRLFSLQLAYNPRTNVYDVWWAERTEAELQLLADQGFTIAFNYHVMTTPPVRVVEFFNRDLSHYFIVAEGAEAAAIDAGSAGPGWQRTGLGFTAWKLDASVDQTISVDVCRFYGSPTIGPNSHFYSVEGPECEMLKRLAETTVPGQPKWNYEGSAFRVEPPGRGGTCAPGQSEVFRLYNNGTARGIDSNHRYTTRLDIAVAMAQQGWVLEGAAFCAKP